MSGTSNFLRPAPMREFDVGERRATWLELFFDLCFVAAVAALSTRLQVQMEEHNAVGGLLSFVGLFVAVWWAWMAFTWFATAWDNDDVAFRLCMFGAMLLVIVVAAAIPGVGGIGGGGTGKEALFASAYAGMQFVLAVMFLRVLTHAGDARPFVLRYLAGNLVGGLIFVGSIAVAPPARYWWWAVGVAVLMTTPFVAVRAYGGQPFDSRHIPERYGLFTIIVLGESVVAVAGGLGDVRLNVDATATAVVGFGIAAAVWWSYFETLSSSALDRDRRLASFLWGYGHLFVYGGIAMMAIGVELAIASAATDAPFTRGMRVLLCGGPAAFLFALGTIHEANERHWDVVVTARLAAIAVLLSIAALGGGMGPLVTASLVFAVLAAETAFDVVHAGGEGLAADHVHEDTVADVEPEPTPT